MPEISYARHRFPPELIQHVVWLYFRFPMSFRGVEDLLAERGVDVACEMVRRWALKCGLAYARKLVRNSLKKQGFTPDTLVTDKLPFYGAALRDLGMTDKHLTGGRSSNRAENSHLPVR